MSPAGAAVLAAAACTRHGHKKDILLDRSKFYLSSFTENRLRYRIADPSAHASTTIVVVYPVHVGPSLSRRVHIVLRVRVRDDAHFHAPILLVIVAVVKAGEAL